MAQVLASAALLAGLVSGHPDPDRPGPLPRCLETVRRAARAAGIADSTWTAATRDFTPDSTVLLADRRQPEFTLLIWDYLAAVVDSERIADGQDRMRTWDSTLSAIESATGVDRHAVMAVWGVESDYGRAMGNRPLVRSLLTGACAGRRRRFFREQLVAALRIVQRGDIPLDQLVGSWAGAFGQTQFLPTTFLAKAVDGDGDGRRDLIRSVPDALWSAARYLERSGWRRNEPWGYEVAVPSDYHGASGRRRPRPAARWGAAGVTRLDSVTLEGAAPLALISPAGPTGPRFLVGRNYQAVWSYNAAEAYTLAIVHLADRMAGGPAFRTPWPTDDPGLSRLERREIKTRLAALGYDPGPLDGSLGPRARAAVAAWERANALPETGRPGQRILARLREQAASAPARTPTPTSPRP